MKIFLELLLSAIVVFGCDKEEKEKCDCDKCPCEQIRDAEPEMEGGEMSDMGLDADLEEDPEEDMAAGIDMEMPEEPLPEECPEGQDC